MSVTSYNVTAGEDFATIATLSGETKVIFSFTPNLIAVKATGDDASITVARFAGAQSGDDGVRTIASGESTTLEPYNGDKFVYINGTGGVEVWAGRAGEEIPPSFKKSAKGGESGGGTHYRGTTTTPISNGSTTNPITIDGEEYTAVFGDIVVYGYTEFVFDGTTWSEFGRPFDTTPTSGSANAVTSDGIYKRTPLARGTGNNSAICGDGTRASGNNAVCFGQNSTASGGSSFAFGYNLSTSINYSTVLGRWNLQRSGDIFEIGNGTTNGGRSNILEANSTSVNINGDIKKNNISLPTPYTTMPTITAAMLGQIAQYVGETTNDYVKGYFYIASSDGAAEPTYSWVSMVDDTPTSGSKNLVTSNGIAELIRHGTGNNSTIMSRNDNTATHPYAMSIGYQTKATQQCALAEGYKTTASGVYSHSENYLTLASGNYSNASGTSTIANQTSMTAIGQYNSPNNGDLFNIGNGTGNNARSNILEANSTSVNVNGNLQMNGVNLPVPYTTMPTITAAMVGQIAQYVGGTDANYTKGWFYEAKSDGAAEPTYYWDAISFNSGGGGVTFNGGLIDELYIYEVIE